MERSQRSPARGRTCGRCGIPVHDAVHGHDLMVGQQLDEFSAYVAPGPGDDDFHVSQGFNSSSGLPLCR